MQRMAFGLRIFALVLANPAFANSVYECSQLKSDTLSEALRARYTERCIENQEATIERAKRVLVNVWAVAANHAKIIDLVSLSALRDGDTPLVPRVQRLYSALIEQLSADNTAGRDVFERFRSKYAEPSELRALYEGAKKTVIGKVALDAAKGIMGDILAEVAPVMKQPLTVAAGAAGNWYFYQCWKPRDAADAAYPNPCKDVALFPARFKETYGMEPTPDTAYAVAWLYRRHMEGGARLVSEYQRIALDLAKELGVAETRPHIQ